MSYSNFYDRLRRLWTVLGLTEEGPEPFTGGRSGANGLVEVRKRAQSGKRPYKHTAERWAYNLSIHCKQHKGAKGALEELINRHTHSLSPTGIFFQGRSINCQDLLRLLLDYTQDQNRNSKVRRGEKLTRSENTWVAVLDDEFAEGHFNLVFFLKEREIVSSAEKSSRGNSDLPRIKSVWSPSFEIDPELLNRLVGKYLLFRIYFTQAELKGKLDDSEGEWGWLGNQWIQVVPVALQEESGGLKWEDYYPDPTEVLHHSIAFIVKEHDAFELFGIDKEHWAIGKFFGKLERFNNGRSRGAIFARDRQTGSYEAYKFYLKGVPDSEYGLILERVMHLAEIFRDWRKTKRDKEKLFSNDGLIFRRVSELLEESECEIVHWLFSPRGFEADDLRSKDVVKRISYANIFRGVKQMR